MKLFGTPKSHFTRKVRILLDHLEEPYELVDIGDVANQGQGQFADNPLMSVPVLEYGTMKLFDSDHISIFLTHRFDPENRFEVITDDPHTLNGRAFLNGAMMAEVRLILAERTGLATNGVAVFDKARKTISNVLAWCDDNLDLFNTAHTTYAQFHFICLWDHLNLNALIENDWPRLRALANTLSESESISRSAPSK
ncbi:MAG: glutathione S-transferase family protein [Pseudomonadota bacterium]